MYKIKVKIYSGLLNLERARINFPPVWSSTGSESAYETIRERHGNIGESLASSFEFYSTSPRDARLLGYVSESSPKPEHSQVRIAAPSHNDTPAISFYFVKSNSI